MGLKQDMNKKGYRLRKIPTKKISTIGVISLLSHYIANKNELWQ
jgi:hypothetical protein